MKKLLLLFLMLTSAIAYSQTQAEMNKEMMDSFEKTDKDLNDVYKKILIEYKSDTIFIKNLKASQRIWISFRDAELKMKYPERAPGWYGTIQPVCKYNYLEELTKERIKTLKAWIDGTEEGDGCAGSIKFKK
jgi:uncharacterized protein YecT (DUF1311 family)